MHIVNLLAGSLFVASVTCNPICKKDFTGACHPVFNLEDETVDSVLPIFFVHLMEFDINSV